jgi:hypothetical protein
MLNRQKIINTIRMKLERDSLPRFQMFFLVFITGIIGFFVSYFLLHAGLTQMWVRYMVAVVSAYIVFLFLLWCWLHIKIEEYKDVPDLSSITSLSDSSFPSDYSGMGGEFGGGGAGESFEAVEKDNQPVSNALECVADGELAIPLFLIIIVIAIAMASLWVVYSAPVLFAELLLDTLLSAGLYKRLRKLELRSWLGTAIRHTFIPFIITVVFISGAGWCIQLNNPSVKSIGEVMSVKPLGR